MNTVTPTNMNFFVASIILIAFLGGFAASLWAMRRWPVPNAPWAIKLPDLLLLLTALGLFPFLFLRIAPPAFWHYFITPSLWLKTPEAAVLFFLGMPLAAWSILTQLKNHSNHAVLLMLLFNCAIAFASSSLQTVIRIYTPPETKYFTLGAYSPIQGAPVPNVRMVINDIDAGPLPLSMNQASVASFHPDSTQRKTGWSPTRLALLSMAETTTINVPPDQGYGIKPAYGYASLKYAAQTAWLLDRDENPDRSRPGSPTLWLDKAESARQHLPLLAWSILHPVAPGQRPAWWSNARAANTPLLWEALLPLADNHPSISLCKTWLIEDTFSNGQPLDQSNAWDVLLRAADSAIDSSVTFPDSIEYTAAMRAGALLSPQRLAQWYRAQPPFTDHSDPFKIKSLSANMPGPRTLTPDSINQARARLAEHVVTAWGLAHFQDIRALGQLGDLINVDLILKQQGTTPALLGGPLFQPTAQRLFDARYKSYRRYGAADSYFSSSYFQGISPYAALPGPVGDLFRAQAQGELISYLRSPAIDDDEIYRQWVNASLFTPVKPSPRQYLRDVWSKAYRNAGDAWSARRTSRNVHPEAYPAVVWRFLAQSVQSTNPADYIDAAKTSISPRFNQSPEDFIEEVGETFDESVLLPDIIRDDIWRALVLAIAASPRQYGLTQPLDKSKLILTRPSPSKDLIAARRFFNESAFAQQKDTTLYLFTKAGLPPAAPALYARQPARESRSLAVDLILRVPTPENLTLLDTLASDPDPAVSARAKSAQTFITRLQSIPVDKLPKPFSDEACTFFDLPEASQ